MASVPAYGALTRAQEDLLKNNYVYGALAKATITSKADNVQFQVHGARKGTDVAGQASIRTSGSLEFAFDQGKLSLKRNNQSVSKLNGEYTPQNLKGYKVKVEARSDAANNTLTGSGTVEYNSDQLKGKLQVTNDPTIKASVTYGKQGYGGFGLDGAYSVKDKRLTAYNAAAYLDFASSTLVFKHVSKDKKAYNIGDVVTSYHRKLNDTTEVGGAITTDMGNRSHTIEFGGSHKPSSDVEVRGKMNSQGQVGLSLCRQVSDSLKVTFASLLDMNKVTATSMTDCKFGVRADFSG